MASAQNPFPDEELLRHSLKQVIDPEIGVNIVDLGLIYALQLSPGRVSLALGMTSPACPMWEMMAAEAEEALRQQLPPSYEIDIERAEEPAWDPERMSDKARSILGW